MRKVQTKYKIVVVILEVRKTLGVLNVSEDNSKIGLTEMGRDGGC
jgi:hypothetical protein